eukprot:TRINITY_DN5579_c0_g1_i1.p1 TRINITY_DN5579_c0_g1~~TRINITY_DN5579_c0_g1_i1.p1  ORF type:complete len:342 (+),score=5.86 TRINITY_DN5579_c0_g1_i1:75-1100(+)
MSKVNKGLEFLRAHLEASSDQEAPIDEQDLGIHIVSIDMSATAGVVAFLGGYTGMKRQGSTMPFFYDSQFVAIFTFQAEPELVWGWAAPPTIADGNGRLDCLAISPRKNHNHLTFSTIDSQKGGLFIVNYSSKIANPVKISGSYANQLLFNTDGSFLFAITSGNRFKEDNSITLNIYSTAAHYRLRSLQFEQPFCNLAMRFPSWKFDHTAGVQKVLRMIHASDSELYAIETKILPDEYALQYRKLGSLPRTTSGWAESSWAVEDRNDGVGERFNVAFGLSNAPPVVLSYLVRDAGEWEENPLTALEDISETALDDILEAIEVSERMLASLRLDQINIRHEI